MSMDIPTVWPPVFGALVLIIAAASAVSNTLTLLALRKRHGVRKVLGTATCALVGCLSLTNVLQGLIALPLRALDRGLNGDWPPVSANSSSSLISRAVVCGLTYFPSTICYNVATWFLLAMAVVRCVLVWWPQTARKWLKTTSVVVLVCAAPIVVGVVGSFYGLLTHAMRIDKAGDRCVPIPYELTPTSIAQYSRYQRTSFLLFVAVPEPAGFVLYVIVYIKLLLSKRKSRKVVGTQPSGSTDNNNHNASLTTLSGNVLLQTNEKNKIHVRSATVANDQRASSSMDNGPGAFESTSSHANRQIPMSSVNAHGAHVHHHHAERVHRSAAPITTTTTYRVQKSDRKLQVVKILGAVYICDLLCICPLYIAWMCGFYSSMRLDSYQLIIGDLMSLCYLSAVPMNSIMYAIVSKDFRRAYENILKCA